MVCFVADLPLLLTKYKSSVFPLSLMCLPKTDNSNKCPYMSKLINPTRAPSLTETSNPNTSILAFGGDGKN